MSYPSPVMALARPHDLSEPWPTRQERSVLEQCVRDNHAFLGRRHAATVDHMCRTAALSARIARQVVITDFYVVDSHRRADARCRLGGIGEPISQYEIGAPMFRDDDGYLVALRYGALLHDIGKGCIPRAIISKQSGLTRIQRSIMKTHPLIGKWMVLHDASFRQACGRHLTLICALIEGHHVSYPSLNRYRLTYRQLCLLLILSMADIIDALSSGRDYRPDRMSKEEILAVMLQDHPHIPDDLLAIGMTLIPE